MLLRNDLISDSQFRIDSVVGLFIIVNTPQAQMSKLAGFETSGSIHLITNNLIGFTAENTSAGSTFSVGDIGKCRLLLGTT